MYINNSTQQPNAATLLEPRPAVLGTVPKLILQIKLAMMAAMALRATPSAPNILATEGNSIPTSSSSSFLSCHNSDLVSQTTGSIAGSSSNRWNISHGLVGLFGQQNDTLNTASSVTTDMAVIAPASDLLLPPLHPVHQISTNLHAHQSQTSLQASNGTNVSQLPEHKSAGEQPKVYCHSGSTTLHGNYSDDCFQCMWSDSQQICHARMGTYNIFIKVSGTRVSNLPGMMFMIIISICIFTYSRPSKKRQKTTMCVSS